MSAAARPALEYWVYENWTAEHKAVVHTGPCGFCKHGHGTDRPKPRGDANGTWHGPYATVGAADTAAQRTGRPVRRHRCV